MEKYQKGDWQRRTETALGLSQVLNCLPNLSSRREEALRHPRCSQSNKLASGSLAKSGRYNHLMRFECISALVVLHG